MNRTVSLGGPIFLLVIGAILYFAVNYQVSGIEVSTIGLILMAAGGVWLLLSLITGMSGSRSTTREEHIDSAGRTSTVDRESEIR